MDLSRNNAKALYMSGMKSAGEQRQINEWARAAGVLPDTSLRVYNNEVIGEE